MNSSVMIIGAGLSLQDAAERARDLGFTVIASCGWERAPGSKEAECHIMADPGDIKRHVSFALANRARFNISGVFGGPDGALTASFVAEALGLPRLPVEAAEAASNRWTLKKRWLEDGVPTPYAEEAGSLAAALKALGRVGLPCMLKSADNSSLCYSRKIESPEEMEPALKELRTITRNTAAYLEELPEGEYYGAEVLAFDGVHHPLSAVDRHILVNPYLVDMGHSGPASLDERLKRSLFEAAACAAASAGLEFGLYSADALIDSGRVLITGIRPAGGFNSRHTSAFSTGADSLKAAIQLATGTEFASKDILGGAASMAFVCKAVFPLPGRVLRVEGVEEARSISGIEEVSVTFREGDFIQPYRSSSWTGCQIIASGGCQKEAYDAWRKAANTVNIVTEDYSFRDYSLAV